MPTITELLLRADVQQKISQRARKVARPPLFTKCDYEDIRQDLAVHLYKKLDHYTATQGDLLAFVHKVLRNRALNLARARQRELPEGGLISWQLLIVETAVEPTDDRRVPGKGRADSAAACEQRLLLAEFTAMLPADLRLLAEDLAQGMTVAEIARQQALPRSTLADRVERLRDRARRAGLEESFGIVPSSAPQPGVVKR